MTPDQGVETPSGLEVLNDWANEFEMQTIPVLDAYDFWTWLPYEHDFSTPTIAHIGPDMRILSVDEGIDDPSAFLGD